MRRGAATKSERQPFHDPAETSILSNGSAKEDLSDGNKTHMAKGWANWFHKASLKDTLSRKKDKNLNVVGSSELTNDHRSSYLAPPLPPVNPMNKLKRTSSSTMSLMRTRRKLITVEELYVEILYTVLHMIGCDARYDPETLVLHLKRAFHMDDEKHRKLNDIALFREEPYLKLNLEIVEARSLIGKDSSGSSDPFCTVYLTTNPMARHYTSYVNKTLNPQWNEEFVLDVNSIETDSLRIDVWDFNPEENVSEKFRKIHEIKDGRGLRKFIKETLNASAGKTTYDLLGCIEVPLKEIPSAGLKKWYPLQKPEAKSKKPRGDILVSLTLSTEKDRNVTAQEHRHLLKIIFAHELESSQVEPFSWEGAFSEESMTILAQHAVQGKLTGADTALARWLVYVYTHCDMPLSYKVFVPILDRLRYSITNNMFLVDEEAKFVEVSAVFVDHCVEFIKQHRHFINSDEKYFDQLHFILKALNILSTILEANDESSDPQVKYKIRRDVSEFNGEDDAWRPQSAIHQLVEEAVKESIEKWQQYAADKLPLDMTKTQKIKNLTAMVRILGSDLKNESTPSHKLFAECMGINYKKRAFEIYEKHLSNSKEFIESTCDELQSVIFKEAAMREFESDTLTIGTSLFELYLALQDFLRTGNDFLLLDTESSYLRNCYRWFHNGVLPWLEIARYKANQRIARAIELDNLKPLDDFVKHSCSAVDIQDVLNQIKTFWHQLEWPDVDLTYTFLSKILHDACQVTVFYADQICMKAFNEQESIGAHSNSKLVVTHQLCVAINNADHTLNFIQSFVHELGMDKILSRLQHRNGIEVARKGKETSQTLILSTKESILYKIMDALDKVGEQMAPFIKKFLIRGCSLMAFADLSNEELLNYLDENLIFLKENLNEANFERILPVIWQSSAKSLSETISMSIQDKKPPSYFKSLLDTLNVLINFFYGDKLPMDETLLKMQGLLQLYASESGELISEYFRERYQEQKSTSTADSDLGSLTVRCLKLKKGLRLEILNARQLRPADLKSHQSRNLSSRQSMMTPNNRLSRSQRSVQWVRSKYSSLISNLNDASVGLRSNATNSRCDPYVSIRLVPAHRFPNYPKLTTTMKRRTLYPLFDEIFDFDLPDDPSLYSKTYILLTVKDKRFLGKNLFLGEALLALDELQVSSPHTNLLDLPQHHLPLTKPSLINLDILLALQSRHFDQIAKQFLRKEELKYV